MHKLRPSYLLFSQWHRLVPLLFLTALWLSAATAVAQDGQWQCCNNRRAYLQLLIDGMRDASNYNQLNAEVQRKVGAHMRETAKGFIQESARLVAAPCDPGRKRDDGKPTVVGCSCSENQAQTALLPEGETLQAPGCISITPGHALVQKLLNEFAASYRPVQVSIALPELPQCEMPSPSPPSPQIVTCSECNDLRIELRLQREAKSVQHSSPFIEDPPPPPQIDSQPSGGVGTLTVLRPGTQETFVVSTPVILSSNAPAAGVGIRVAPYRAYLVHNLAKDDLPTAADAEPWWLFPILAIARTSGFSISGAGSASPFGSAIVPEAALKPLLSSVLTSTLLDHRDPLLSDAFRQCLKTQSMRHCLLNTNAVGLGLGAIWTNETFVRSTASYAYANWDILLKDNQFLALIASWRFYRPAELKPVELGARYGFEVAQATISGEVSFRLGSGNAEQRLQPALNGTLPVGPILVDVGLQLQLPVAQEHNPAARLLVGLGWSGTNTREAVAKKLARPTKR